MFFAFLFDYCRINLHPCGFICEMQTHLHKWIPSFENNEPKGRNVATFLLAQTVGIV